jgi:hypothetical protein
VPDPIELYLKIIYLISKNTKLRTEGMCLVSQYYYQKEKKTQLLLSSLILLVRISSLIFLVRKLRQESNFSKAIQPGRGRPGI